MSGAGFCVRGFRGGGRDGRGFGEGVEGDSGGRDSGRGWKGLRT